jgi:UDP-N-acetylglucosamine acyltransferase
LRAAYRAIFLEGTGSIQDNAKRVARQWSGVPEVKEVIDFILADAKRPICPARRGRDLPDEE